MRTPGRGRLIRVVLLSSIAAAPSSCTVLQAPVTPPPIVRRNANHMMAGEVELSATPIQSTDDYWELFDDNLPEIGLVALWIEMRNTGSRETDLSRVRWELRRGTLLLREASVDDIFKQYYRRRQVRLYSVNSDLIARKAMSGALMKSGRLQPSESCSGFLVFKSKSPLPQDWSHDGVLVGRGFPPRSGGRKTVELPLTHANP